ncbi:MAG: 2-C-methyl-D-erythritol 4-phosphate cytidylyltransferase [Acidobacteria bacterium]|nr:2-C-methyl-D-erythritol 4-phosphate cytidylyltransferase [Acidobacteriota bacterium]
MEPEGRKGYCAAAVLAGGTGSRAGAPVPKQFVLLDEMPVIVHTLRTFRDSGLFGILVVAIHPEWIDTLEEILQQWDLVGAVSLVPGGATRQDSSWAALSFLRDLPDPPDRVLVHDAARCLADADLLRRCVDGLREHAALTAAVGVTDTLAEVEPADETSVPDRWIVGVPDRRRLVRVQTPQGFRLEVILAAHRAAQARGTTGASDDAQLVLANGGTVHVVEGAGTNLKISHPEDFALAEWLLRRSEGRG